MHRRFERAAASAHRGIEAVGPNTRNKAEVASPSARLISSACATSASASPRRPAPSARATAEEMPPPTAPADNIVIIMKPGKTSAMPVSASVPRRETHQVSIRPVEACASMTRMFGQASRSRVGTIGPFNRRSVRASSPARPAIRLLAELHSGLARSSIGLDARPGF